ncbi:MAG: conjugal transfer protein TraX [Candidatus Saccharibacteria bacterium]|nr:conjugal transfer protein TraX [Candidatus Saccharibacteria bacterium]
MLSSAVLQIIAIVTMVIDHVGCYFFPEQLWLRAIGRMAFPIFAFLLVEGFKHTRSFPKYFARILVTAIVAQFAIAFLDKWSNYNVLFSFCFSLIALLCIEYGGFFIVAIPLLVLAAGAVNCSYGIWGVLLVLGFYCVDGLFRDKFFTKIALNLAVLTAITLLMINEYAWPVQIFAIFASVPIALYSGKKGRRLPRIFGYVFYPAHLFIIVLIRLLFL